MSPRRPLPPEPTGAAYVVLVPSTLFMDVAGWAHSAGLQLLPRAGRDTQVELARIPGNEVIGRENGLTPRQTEILAMIAEGLDNRGIGARMYLSPETVRTHVRLLLANLGVHDRAAAVDRGWRLGILTNGAS